MRRWIAHRDEQEDSQRHVEAQHHGVACIRASRMQQRADQGINASRKEQSDPQQHSLQRPFSPHGASALFVTDNMMTYPIIAALRPSQSLKRHGTNLLG